MIVGQIDTGLVVEVDWYGKSDELSRNGLYDVKDHIRLLQS